MGHAKTRVMNVSAWFDLCAPPHVLRLAPTLLSGMSFRWWYRPQSDSYFGVVGNAIFELRETDETCFFRTHMAVVYTEEGDASAAIRAHLSLDRGPSPAAWKSIGLPRQYHNAVQALPGVRVLSISALEAVITFVGSANNNIKRNMQMIRALCAEFAANSLDRDADGVEHFSFPSVEQLASITEERLWELGWGYRAPRLFKLARQLEERGGEAWLATLASMSEAAAREALMQLCGIGRKVADCILLFSFGCDSCVPVDTHCFQLAQRYLLPSRERSNALTAKTYQLIVDQFHKVFGEQHTGWAFMTLFVAELSDFRSRLTADPACQHVLPHWHTAMSQPASAQVVAQPPLSPPTHSEFPVARTVKRLSRFFGHDHEDRAKQRGKMGRSQPASGESPPQARQQTRLSGRRLSERIACRGNGACPLEAEGEARGGPLFWG